MLKRFLPKQGKFFDFFGETATLLVRASESLLRMLQHPTDCQTEIETIAGYEKQGDQIARHTFNLLHKTFITPFDRYDINSLISGLDDILDLINRSAQHFPAYTLQQIPAEMIQMAELAIEAARLLHEAVIRLHSLERAAEIFHYCEEINQVENHAHEIGLMGEKKLFEEETDFRQFFRLKEMYSQIKSMINCCQDVANLIRGIVLEYS